MVPDGARELVLDLRGRSLPGVPGSLVTGLALERGRPAADLSGAALDAPETGTELEAELEYHRMEPYLEQ